MGIPSETPTPGKNSAWGLVLLCLIAVTLRVAMVAWNRDANDEHFTVIRLILDQHRLPLRDECWECFQPKAYHAAVAAVLACLGKSGAGNESLLLAGGLLNLIAGVATLALAGTAIHRYSIGGPWLKLSAFGLMALNPALVGISSQATNDAFAILFSTAALIAAGRFLERARPWPFLAMAVCAALAIACKTNTLVTAMAIFVALVAKAIVVAQRNGPVSVSVGEAAATPEGHGNAMHAFGFALAVAALSIANPLNQYSANQRAYGTPLALNMERNPSPPWFATATGNFRPGILSVAGGFFTFRLADLLEHPRLDNGKDEYATNRTSFWTLLYGRAHSLHYDNWPQTWRTEGRQGFRLTRAIFLLALLPTAMVGWGAIRESRIVVAGLLQRNGKALGDVGYGLATLCMLGYLAFVALYAYLYRDFSVMKTIFLYPALLALPLCYLRAGEALLMRLGRFPWAPRAFAICIGSLLGLYALEILSMIRLLAGQPHPF